MCCTPASGELGLTDQNHVCSCSSAAPDATTDAQRADPAEVVREHYLVEGMTCSHCVSSVTEEISAVDGVDSVSVELNTGGASRVMVTSSRPIAEESILAAVTEAGYSLVAAR